jgi:hypothetical protein
MLNCRTRRKSGKHRRDLRHKSLSRGKLSLTLAVLQMVDSACVAGLIMQFAWSKVAEAQAGIGALLAGLLS